MSLLWILRRILLVFFLSFAVVCSSQVFDSNFDANNKLSMKEQRQLVDPVIPLDTCMACCEAVRVLNFWVGAQHTGSCNKGGCTDLTCGNGFACNVGLNFRTGKSSGFQTDGNGNFVAYNCLSDGTVSRVGAVTSSPTKFPTKQPTKNPTRNPTKNPTHAPTKKTTNTPTVLGATPSPTTEYPTAFPVTESPTLFPATLSPVTSSPTFNLTGRASNPEVNTFLDKLSHFFNNTINLLIFIAVIIALCALSVLLIIPTKPSKNKGNKKNKKGFGFNLFGRQKSNSEFEYAFERGRNYTDDFRKSNFHISIKGPWLHTKNLFSSNPETERIVKDRNSQTRNSLSVAVPPSPEELDEQLRLSQRARFRMNEEIEGDNEDEIWEFREKSVSGYESSSDGTQSQSQSHGL